MIYPWSNEKQQFYTVILDETVKNIPIGAFSGFINLKFFSFSSSLEKINDYGFYNTGLTELYLNDSGIISLGNNSFSNNKFLRNIVLPKELQKIGNYCFSKCKNLKSIVIPDSVIEIGEYSFEHCDNLETIEIGKNVIKIDGTIFSGCNKLKNIKIKEENQHLQMIENVIYDKNGEILMFYLFTSTQKEFKVPDNVLTIGKYAFKILV